MNQTNHRRYTEARNKAFDAASTQVTTKAPEPDFQGSLVWRCSVPDCGETMQFTMPPGTHEAAGTGVDPCRNATGPKSAVHTENRVRRADGGKRSEVE